MIRVITGHHTSDLIVYELAELDRWLDAHRATEAA